MKKKLINSILLILATGCFFSCSKDTLVEKPPHVITDEVLYTNLDGFEAGLNGMYAVARMMREPLNEFGHSMRGALFMFGTDNATVNHSNPGFMVTTEVWQGNNNAQDGDINEVFNWLYSLVNTANTIISTAENKNIDWNGGAGSPSENKDRVLAHARALRGWAYRYLTFGWGDVPLNLEESNGDNIRTDWERTPVNEVRNQIIHDFSFAQQHLNDNPAMRGRLTKGAVQTYLSEMYLTIHKPDSALYWADQVINNPAYRLITERYGVKASQPGSPFMDMFYDGNSNREEGNSEALWVFQFSRSMVGSGQSEMTRYIASRYWRITIGGVTALQPSADRGGYGYGRFAFTKWALGIYDEDDDRGNYHAIRKFYILKDAQQNAPVPADNLPPGYNYGDTIKCDWSTDITPTNKGLTTWPFSRKFDDGTDPENPLEFFTANDQIYLRLAETYFLKAEAQLQLNDITGATETINTLRRRANTREISPSELTLDFLLDERSRELAFEEDRRIVLLRNGKWVERTKLYNHNGGQNVAARDTLYPIPQSVIDANLTKKMDQNPGF